MQTEVFGIDFSGDANKWKPSCTNSNVWVARGALRDGELHVANLVRIQDLPGPEEPFLRLSRLLSTNARRMQPSMRRSPFHMRGHLMRKRSGSG